MKSHLASFSKAVKNYFCRSRQAVAQAVNDAIRIWNLENLVRGICFGTTSSNIGRKSGAYVLLEQLLGRPLLYFDYRHYILELVLTATFSVCVEPDNAPEILIFKGFKHNGYPLIRKVMKMPSLMMPQLNYPKSNMESLLSVSSSYNIISHETIIASCSRCCLSF